MIAHVKNLITLPVDCLLKKNKVEFFDSNIVLSLLIWIALGFYIYGRLCFVRFNAFINVTCFRVWPIFISCLYLYSLLQNIFTYFAMIIVTVLTIIFVWEFTVQYEEDKVSSIRKFIHRFNSTRDNGIWIKSRNGASVGFIYYILFDSLREWRYIHFIFGVIVSILMFMYYNLIFASILFVLFINMFYFRMLFTGKAYNKNAMAWACQHLIPCILLFIAFVKDFFNKPIDNNTSNPVVITELV